MLRGVPVSELTGRGIYLAGGTLELSSNVNISNNTVTGSAGGHGGNGGSGGCDDNPAGDCDDQIDAGAAGNGGPGRAALGGGIYQAGGSLYSSSSSNSITGKAIGGTGGSPGTPGSGAPSNYACKWGGGASGSMGATGNEATGYQYASGNHVFSSNSALNALGVPSSGMYMSGGSLNRSTAVPSIKASATQVQGVLGVTLGLYSTDGTLIATTQTDSSGRYTFHTNFSGQGYIQVTPTPNFDFAPQGSRTATGHFSGIDPATMHSKVVTFLSGQPVNGHVDVILARVKTEFVTSGNMVKLVRSDDHSTIWQTAVMPSSYHSGFTVATMDLNGDHTTDYVLIPRTGQARPIFVDGRTGTPTMIANAVNTNLRAGFSVLPFNLSAGSATTQWIFAPSNNKSGLISLVDLQTRQTLWNAHDRVLGGMTVKAVIAPTRTGDTPAIEAQEPHPTELSV